MTLASQLRSMGLSDTQIAGATIGGKPLAEAEPVRKPRQQFRSKAEQQYAWELRDKLVSGEIRWWAYEPITLVVADAAGVRARYSPDFLVLENDGTLTAIEIKGKNPSLKNAGRTKFLAAKERYTFIRFRCLAWREYEWEEILT